MVENVHGMRVVEIRVDLQQFGFSIHNFVLPIIVNIYQFSGQGYMPHWIVESQLVLYSVGNVLVIFQYI